METTRKIPAILIAGVSSGSGKTTVTRGIFSCFVDKGIKVQSYKLGPDYIDSGHHAVVTGRPCINLDRYLLSVPDVSSDKLEHSSDQLLDEFYGSIGDAEVLVIEAVGGLFDRYLPLGEIMGQTVEVPALCETDCKSDISDPEIPRNMIDAAVQYLAEKS